MSAAPGRPEQARTAGRSPQAHDLDTQAADAGGLAPEDAGRANLYALLARLFSAGPDDALLRSIAASGNAIVADSELGRAWARLVAAAAQAGPRQATIEFDTLFIGVGKAPVSTYLSRYLPAARKETALVELRDTLAGLGLARKATSVEPEDNLASLLETMRHLVSAGSDAEALAHQRAFFDRYLAPAYKYFCVATAEVELSEFYRAAVALLEAFLDADLAQTQMV